ncbi:MAG: polymer-forming cytoskeletal protein [Alphaproteobacteria bacterium]|nr:polymer-forming cytoskeletal protein [Alphaproteobacteria bacterium]
MPEPAKRPVAVSRAGPSLISADVKMKGSIVSQGEVQIDGHIEGDVRASALTIGDTGAVKGEVVAESIVVRGTVEGRIRARKVQLCTGAKVRGDIFHASLAIEPNAIFEGAVKHAQDPMADQPGPVPVPPPVA